jgi:hypothetical protein
LGRIGAQHVQCQVGAAPGKGIGHPGDFAFRGIVLATVFHQVDGVTGFILHDQAQGPKGLVAPFPEASEEDSEVFLFTAAVSGGSAEGFDQRLEAWGQDAEQALAPRLCGGGGLHLESIGDVDRLDDGP